MSRYLCLVACMMLTGCGTYSQPHVNYSPSRQEAGYVFSAANVHEAMDTTERTAIEQTLARIPEAAAKRATIETNERGLMGSVKVNELTMMLKEAGFEDGAINVALVGHDRTPLRLRLHYKTHPYAEHCPDWHSSGTFNQHDDLAGHFGCSSLINLNAMVADKNDLIKARQQPHAETESAVRAVEAYYGGGSAGSSSASGSSSGSSSDSSAASGGSTTTGN